LIAATPGDFVSINMEVNPSSPPFTGYWTRRGLDGIERIIVIDDVKYDSRRANLVTNPVTSHA
jgi:hypothetical protein